MTGLFDCRRRAPRVLFALVHLLTSSALVALAFLALVIALGPHPVASRPAPVGWFWAVALAAAPLLCVQLLFEARRLADIGVRPAWCLWARVPFTALVVVLVSAPSPEEPPYDAILEVLGAIVQSVELGGFVALALIPGQREPNAAGVPPPSPWKLGSRAVDPV